MYLMEFISAFKDATKDRSRFVTNAKTVALFADAKQADKEKLHIVTLGAPSSLKDGVRLTSLSLFQ